MTQNILKPLPGSTNGATPILSIVIPVYFNELNLPATIPKLEEVANQLVGDAYELLFVDDGSKDRSFEVLTDHQRRKNSRVRIVKLTRNFGSMAAIQAGLSVARGSAVGIITADLQDPPELLTQMLARWREGVKCVYAVRKERDEGLLKRLFAAIFYRMLRRFALPDYPAGGFDYCLIDRQVVDEVVKMNEKNTHVMNLIFWLGYPAVWIPYTRRARTHGRSRWTFSKRLKLFADSFVAFSYAPIRAVTVCGSLLALLAVLYTGFQIYDRIANGTPVRGFTTTVALLAFTSGIQMLMLGVLGEYLWRTLDATRSRPTFVVDRIQEPPAHE